MTSVLRAWVLVAAASLTLAACGSSGDKDDASSGNAGADYAKVPDGPIVLGVSVPLSGQTAAFGLNTKRAFTVAQREFDAAHPKGIDGHPVRIKVLDDAGDVTKAVSVARQLATERVAGVVAVSYNPQAADQQLAVLNKGKIPVISTSGGRQYTDTRAWPYTFGLGGSQPQQADSAAEHIAAKGYTRVATLTDGIPSVSQAVDEITKAIETDAPKAKVVKAVTVPPGTVDLSAAVAQLKAARPELLIVYLGFGYGPLWSAMRSASFAPQIMSNPAAWYDGFAAMGPLAKRAVTPYWDCADSVSQSFPSATSDLMAKYSAASGGTSVNYLTYVASSSVPLELLKYAIEKHHSTDPDAIKDALEQMPRTSFYGLEYQYSESNHFGATGRYGPAVCNMAPPYAGGKAKVPVKAQQQ